MSGLLLSIALRGSGKHSGSYRKAGDEEWVQKHSSLPMWKPIVGFILYTGAIVWFYIGLFRHLTADG